MKTIARTLGLIALLVVVAAAVDRVSGPFFSFSTQSWEPERRGDKLIGVAEGPIKSTDATSHTLRIASGFLGLDSLSLDVTADTIIAIHGKLGGLGDLDRGQLVRVAYEVASDRLVASRVELLNVGSATALMAIPTSPTSDVSENAPPDRPERADDAATPSAIEPAMAPPVVLPVPSAAPTPPVAPAASIPPAVENTGDESRRSASSAEATTATRAEKAELPPRPEVTIAPPAPPVPPVSPPPPPSAPAAASGPRPAALPPRRPVAAKPLAPPPANAALPRREADDAGAVIDWLLNSPSRSPQVADAP